MGSTATTLRKDATKPVGGPGNNGPLRRCIVSGVRQPKEDMLRFVIGPDGGVVVDIAGDLPGRGFWLSANRDMVNKASEKNLFSKAARLKVDVPADLVSEAERLLVRKCLDLIGLARRSGQVVAGFDQVKAWLQAGKSGVLLGAADGARDGRNKIRASGRDLPLIEVFCSEELGAAIGRLNAVHMMIAPGRLADKLLIDAERLSGFRTTPNGPAKAGGNGL